MSNLDEALEVVSDIGGFSIFELVLPDSVHFVYLLVDEENEVFYIGETGNLLSRLGKHSRTHRRLKRMKIICCDSKREARLLESLLIRRLKPVLNRYGVQL